MKRRDFLKSTGLVAGASVLGGMSVARGANVGGDDVIKIALVGCGGRGRGAVADRFSAKDNVKLVAIADAFEANAKAAAEAFQNMNPDGVDLGDRVFWGFDAYKKAIDECDQALIVTSPGFRPIHYKYAIEQGKHVFMEKP
ncbi:MAG: Gfo/Idh/MocA family oxidoreductase [Thermoguttaceae bacterium]|nr:Gfo/Idh/MocA family oxidoreductase [Thermoguttaceae bacterium]